jgi:hypothetical protein
VLFCGKQNFSLQIQDAVFIDLLKSRQNLSPLGFLLDGAAVHIP